MKPIRCAALFMFSAMPASAESDVEPRLWTAYYQCLEQNVSDVALHVESLEEGANLIFSSLCNQSGTDLMNAVARRDIFEGDNRRDRFTHSRAVILRETRLRIYQARVRMR